MPLAALKALPARARALWVQVYDRHRAGTTVQLASSVNDPSEGLSEEEAAQRAWAAVKRGWKKTRKGWVKMESYLLVGGVLGEYVLADDGSEKTLFRKALIRVGEWLDPRDEGTSRFQVTPDRIRGWLENFRNGRPDLVPVPIGHAGYDNALMNTGYVRDMEFDGDTLWGVIEFTNAEAAELAEGGSIPATSIAVTPDWVDTESGESYGEAIYHVALTQRPHIERLPGFQPMMAEMGEPILMESAEFGVPTKKESGHKSPPKGYPTEAADYADPRNYKYPITRKFVRAAIGYFHKAIESGDYSEDELKTMARRIARRAKEYGIDLDPESDVGEYAGLKKKTKAERPSTGAEDDTPMTAEVKTKIQEAEDATKRAEEATEKAQAAEKAAKLEKEAAEKERSEFHATEDERTVDDIIGGKVKDAKFGLPQTARKPLLVLLQHGRTAAIELEGGEKKQPRQLVVGLMEQLVREGLVPLSEIAKTDDTEPGKDEDPQKFVDRQLERKGYKKPDKSA